MGWGFEAPRQRIFQGFSFTHPADPEIPVIPMVLLVRCPHFGPPFVNGLLQVKLVKIIGKQTYDG